MKIGDYKLRIFSYILNNGIYTKKLEECDDFFEKGDGLLKKYIFIKVSEVRSKEKFLFMLVSKEYEKFGGAHKDLASEFLDISGYKKATRDDLYEYDIVGGGFITVPKDKNGILLFSGFSGDFGYPKKELKSLINALKEEKEFLMIENIEWARLVWVTFFERKTFLWCIIKWKFVGGGEAAAPTKKFLIFKIKKRKLKKRGMTGFDSRI